MNRIYNIGMGVSFVSLLLVVLYFKYKGKPSPEEIQLKTEENKMYILSKIKNYQTAKLRQQQDLITGLPHY